MSELLPCPFCGGGVELLSALDVVDDEYFYIECPTGGCIGSAMDEMVFKLKDPLIKAWNTRHQPEGNDVALAIMKEKNN